MSYSKPYTYVNGTVVSAADQNNNDNSSKKYINQGIVAADYSAATIDFDQIEVGELEAVTSAYRFMSGEVWGVATGTDLIDRAYFTSHIRNGKQTAVNPSIFQTIYNSGQTLDLIYPADILITFGGTAKCEENDVQAKGRWDSTVILRYKEAGTNSWVSISGCEAFTFEETHAAGVAPRAVTNTNPFPFAYPASIEPEDTFRRFIGWTWVVKNIPPGRYQFSVAVKSKAEEGYISARSFTCEVFYS